MTTPEWRSWSTPGIAHLFRPGEDRSVCGRAQGPRRNLNPDDHLCGSCQRVEPKVPAKCQCPLHRDRP